MKKFLEETKAEYKYVLYYRNVYIMLNKFLILYICRKYKDRIKLLKSGQGYDKLDEFEQELEEYDNILFLVMQYIFNTFEF